MIDDSGSLGLVIGWVTLAALIVVIHHRRCPNEAGLVLSWLLGLALIHWLAAVVYVLPWYEPRDFRLTQQGFLQSLFAVMGFGIGVLVLSPLIHLLDPPIPPYRTAAHSQSARFVSISYLIVGTSAYFFLERLVFGIPTLAGVVATGLSVVVGGLCLACWKALGSRQGSTLVGWLVFSGAYPIATIVTQGFLGFGAFAVLPVACFVAVRYRPRRYVVLVALAVTYLALSIFVTYIRDRVTIRDSLGAGAPLSDRLDQVIQSVRSFELFDPTNSDHLGRIDARLNQNYFVGAAVSYLADGNRDFANGKTVWDAVLALIPRAVWPTKPVVAGSGTLVSDYTGVDLAYGTSFGIGPVMEFYVNYGTAGVVEGFIVIGMLVGALNRSAGLSLAQGDLDAFTFRFVPALALLNVGVSLVELTGGVAATFVMIFVLNRLVLPTIWHERTDDRRVISGARPRVVSATPGPASIDETLIMNPEAGAIGSMPRKRRAR